MGGERRRAVMAAIERTAAVQLANRLLSGEKTAILKQLRQSRAGMPATA
jgi:hypothetical protein